MNRLLTGLLAGLCLTQLSLSQRHHFEHEGVLGTSMDLTVLADDAAAAEAVERAVLQEVRRLDALLSGHVETSEFRAFVASRAPMQISTDLFAVLTACDRWGRSTGGAFDAAFERRVRSAAIAEAHGAGYRSPWRLDAAARTAVVLERVALGVDGLAKGYVIDRAIDAGRAARADVRGIVLDIGGDIRAVGGGPHAVRVTDPRAPADNAEPLFTVRLADAAIATSGSYARRAANGDGVEGSHILDPADGRPARHVASATVIAPTCCDADALATALNVMPVERGLQLVESLAGVECAIVDAAGACHRSSGIDRLIVAPAAEPRASDALASAFDVSLTFRIGAPEQERRRHYRRPYVAVWIEDEDGRPIRTLCLWIEGRRWLRDLKTWYKLHRREQDLIDDVSRATRRPGEYTLSWNGRDDQGRDLPAGDYTLLLEVAREHGTHQLMRAPVRCEHGYGAVLDPNVEIESAVLTVSRRGADEPK